jgi:hypothetical protein
MFIGSQQMRERFEHGTGNQRAVNYCSPLNHDFILLYFEVIFLFLFLLYFYMMIFYFDIFYFTLQPADERAMRRVCVCLPLFVTLAAVLVVDGPKE